VSPMADDEPHLDRQSGRAATRPLGRALPEQAELQRGPYSSPLPEWGTGEQYDHGDPAEVEAHPLHEPRTENAWGCLHMSFDGVMTSTSRPFGPYQSCFRAQVLPFSGSRGPLAAFHVEQDLPAGTITGGRKHIQRLGVLIDREAVSDKPGRLEAASIEEPDDKRPGCGGIAEASAD